MRSLRPGILVAALLAAGAGWAAPKAGAKAGPPKQLWIAFTSNVSGKLTFCNTCGYVTQGGMPQKAALFKRWRRELGAPLLVLDAGNCLEFSGDWKAAPVMLKTMDIGGFAAANVGDAEAAFASDLVARAARGTDVKWVSCNVRLANGKAAFPASVIINAGGLRVAVIGVLDRAAVADGFPPNEGWRIEDGIECAKQEAQRLSGKYDVLVVLAHAPESRLEEYAKALPQAALIAGGSQQRPLPEPKKVGESLIFQPHKYQVARVKLAPKAGRWVAEKWERIAVYRNAPVDEDAQRVVQMFTQYGR